MDVEREFHDAMYSTIESIVGLLLFICHIRPYRTAMPGKSMVRGDTLQVYEIETKSCCLFPSCMERMDTIRPLRLAKTARRQLSLAHCQLGLSPPTTRPTGVGPIKLRINGLFMMIITSASATLLFRACNCPSRPGKSQSSCYPACCGIKRLYPGFPADLAFYSFHTSLTSALTSLSHQSQINQSQWVSSVCSAIPPA